MPLLFSCDWGTTSFRLRRVDPATGAVLGERRESAGAGALLAKAASTASNDRGAVFEEFLRGQLTDWFRGNAAQLNGAAVLVSGMASSSVGWRELPYARAPVALDGSNLVHAAFDIGLDAGARACVYLFSGVRTDNDIMRGEETEIVGLFASRSYDGLAEDGILILPGTHSKHVRLRQRCLVDFRTYMTGELFAVLSAHSLLRASVELGSTHEVSRAGPAREAFFQGVEEARSAGLAAGLFQVRVRTVLKQAALSVNHWFLSGLLIGAELSGLASEEGDPPILLAAAEPLSSTYQLAFQVLGLAPRLTVVPPGEMALAALRGHLALWPAVNRPGLGGGA